MNNCTFASMGKWKVLRSFFRFLYEKKIYWMYPIIIVIVLIGILVLLGEGSAVSPFIYSIF